jgi:hypothetical protein
VGVSAFALPALSLPHLEHCVVRVCALPCRARGNLSMHAIMMKRATQYSLPIVFCRLEGVVAVLLSQGVVVTAGRWLKVAACCEGVCGRLRTMWERWQL